MGHSICQFETQNIDFETFTCVCVWAFGNTFYTLIDVSARTLKERCGDEPPAAKAKSTVPEVAASSIFEVEHGDLWRQAVKSALEEARACPRLGDFQTDFHADLTMGADVDQAPQGREAGLT